ncbi:hypothetical protein KM043_001730 [Ampulex compressa]|nr:hypothetical protein KM043_001730 [Ampulex compressa]
MFARRAAFLFESRKRRASTDARRPPKDICRNLEASDFRKVTENYARIVECIARNTEITRDHMTPELRLSLLTPNCPLYHAPLTSLDAEDAISRETRRTFSEPFWSIYWPGGQALAKFILEEGREILKRRGANGKNVSVLDLGAGCGAASIAAKMIGARHVLANDIDQVACLAALTNAALNNVKIQVSRENLLTRVPDESHGVILVGDLLYDEDIAGDLIPWLEGAFEKGSEIYLGDPGRHGLTSGLRERLHLLKEYGLPEKVQRENRGYDKAGIWTFRPS